MHPVGRSRASDARVVRRGKMALVLTLTGFGSRAGCGTIMVGQSLGENATCRSHEHVLTAPTPGPAIAAAGYGAVPIFFTRGVCHPRRRFAAHRAISAHAQCA